MVTNQKRLVPDDREGHIFLLHGSRTKFWKFASFDPTSFVPISFHFFGEEIRKHEERFIQISFQKTLFDKFR